MVRDACWKEISSQANGVADIPTCDTLVKRIEKEAEEALQKVNSLIVPQSKL